MNDIPARFSLIAYGTGSLGTYFISDFQIEEGHTATSYQYTDKTTLGTDAGYGMWSIAGGFGGTIQNPIVTVGNYGFSVFANTSFSKELSNNEIAIGNLALTTSPQAAIALTNTGTNSTSGFYVTDISGEKVVSLQLDGTHTLSGWTIKSGSIEKDNISLSSQSSYVSIQNGTRAYAQSGIFLGTVSGDVRASFYKDSDNAILLDTAASGGSLSIASTNFTLKGADSLLMTTTKLALGSSANSLSLILGTGFYADSAGKFKVGSTNQYIRFGNTAGALEVKTPKLEIDNLGNVTMEGKVTASSGSIANWELTEHVLHANNGGIYGTSYLVNIDLSKDSYGSDSAKVITDASKGNLQGFSITGYLPALYGFRLTMGQMSDDL